MDFTFLFIIILMLLAIKSQLWFVAAGLFVLLLVTSKSKYLLFATLIGGGLAAADYLQVANAWVILGVLFGIVLLLAKKDSDHPGPEGYMPGGMPPYG